jgi:hypothetical protein
MDMSESPTWSHGEQVERGPGFDVLFTAQQGTEIKIPGMNITTILLERHQEEDKVVVLVRHPDGGTSQDARYGGHSVGILRGQTTIFTHQLDYDAAHALFQREQAANAQ